MGSLCDDFRWRLRLDFLRLCGVVSLKLFFVWPFKVASVLGRYLSTRSDINPGHDMKALCLMAWIKVLLDGLKQAA